MNSMYFQVLSTADVRNMKQFKYSEESVLQAYMDYKNTIHKLVRNDRNVTARISL